jgi:hypothetical protein
MTDERVTGWLAAATADAARRGLDELRPLLEALARSTAALRKADLQAQREPDAAADATAAGDD